MGDRVQSLWRFSANLPPSPWSLGSALICPRSCCCWVCLPFPRLHLWPLKPPVFTEDPPEPHPMPLDSRTDWCLWDMGSGCSRLLEKYPGWLHLETLLALVSLGHLLGPMSLVTTVHDLSPPPLTREMSPALQGPLEADYSPCMSSTTHAGSGSTYPASTQPRQADVEEQ